MSPAIKAEANRSPVTIPSKTETSHDDKRLVVALRRSELRFRRAAVQAVKFHERKPNKGNSK